MQYLITGNSFAPFFTDYYTSENCFNPDVGMIVYDLVNTVYTSDGVNWIEIEIDHL